MGTRVVQVELGEFEIDLVMNPMYREDLLHKSLGATAAIMAKLAQAIEASQVAPGDCVNWGPRPYGATGLLLIAIDGDLGWCRTTDNTYVELPVAELWKAAR